MAYFHTKICTSVAKISKMCNFTNAEAPLRNTTRGLNFLHMTRGYDESYIKTLKYFRDYVKQFKIWAANDIEIFKLSKYITVLENPPVKFSIGTRVQHTRHGFKSNSSSLIPDNITYEYGVVDDYDYTVNQYQLLYDNGSTVGWIPEKDLSIINE